MDDSDLYNKNSEKHERRKPLRRTRPLCTKYTPSENIPPSLSTASSSKPVSTTLASTPITTTTTVSIEMGRKSSKDKDKDKDKKKRGPIKERWLLTRKTWKYMTDAGRRLIPDGAQNRTEDLSKIEDYFQQVCRSEPRFILWKRKCSFPGARTTSRRFKWRTGGSKGSIPKALRLGTSDVNDEQSQNADQIIQMLKTYLNISDEKKTAALLGSQTFRPDQTESPSSQRPMTFQMTASKFYIPSNDGGQKASEISDQISELLDRLRSYSQSCNRFLISPDMITTDILGNKFLLKKIYTELKKQQLHRILGQHTKYHSPHLPHSSSLSSLWHFRRDTNATITESTDTVDNIETTCTSETPKRQIIPEITVKKVAQSEEKKLSTLGIQTDFIPLHVLQQMAKDYELSKKEEERLNRQTDEEIDKGTFNHSRRKSSLDEDISQSVSDTIKRYLRMARKKSIAEDPSNRFRRVNYDRNLRNIRAKGEINPPGMDEGNTTKATQTLDAWPVIALSYIRGADNVKLLEEAHRDWKSSLERRILQKEQYEQKLKEQQQQQKDQKDTDRKSSSGQSSPSSPQSSTGLFHTGTQFLSNLWHGHHHSAQDSATGVNIPESGGDGVNVRPTATMQKSKSSSNVGQFVSKKIWRSRSKSQTRTSSPSKPDWTPQGNCIWTSSNGKRLILSDTKLQDLTEIERKVLHRVAIEKINQLNIGVSVTAPGDSSNVTTKAQKRRPLLIKRKALTTGFFDSGKKGDSKGSESGGLVFGISLEKCVDNDHRIHKDTSERDSRNSVISLLSGNSGKSSENVGSCESLPSKSQYFGQSNNIGLVKSSTMQISRSQSDIRGISQDYDDIAASAAPPMVYLSRNNIQQVPALVTECIRHLEEYGLHTVGIFRVSTSKKRIRQLREDFDKGEITSLNPDICPHDVATILKEYLRDLPEPLICRNLYKAFVKTQKIRNRRLQLEALSHLVQLLPVTHRDTLYVILKFLAKIVRSSDDVISRDGTILSIGNKMDSSNLATVFAPNILRYTTPGQSTTEQEIDDQIDVINVVRIMIDHYEELFRVPAELLDEVYTNMIDTFPQQLDYLCERRDISEKYDDDMESGTLSTVISSKQQQVHQQHQQQISNELIKQQINTERTASTPRRIYSREDFLHENAAKGDPNGNGVPRRRERVSKMKYVENEHEVVRRRRRERYINENTSIAVNSNANTGNRSIQQLTQNTERSNSNIIDDSHSISQMIQQQNQTFDSSNNNADNTSARRLSSPYILHTTGVVTASLKIPVQMQSTTANIQQQTSGYIPSYPDGSNRTSNPLDLPDIPYIEDVEGQFKQTPITVSLSFRNRRDSNTSNTYQIPISYEGRLLNSPSDSSSTSPEIQRSSPLSTIGSSSSMVSVITKRSDSVKRPARKHSSSSNSNVAMISYIKPSNELSSPTSPTSSPSNASIGDRQTGNGHNAGSTVAVSVHIEPKVTTSITNIGGAVLRSKTADFERMLMQNKKYKTGDNENASKNLNTSNVGDTGRGIITKTDDVHAIKTSTSSSQPLSGNNDGFDDKSRRPSQGPIYKRQELISSAKRSSK